MPAMITMFRLQTIILLGLSLAIIALAVAGGVLNYSPVPFWDMWNGTLQFVMNFNDGDRWSLWSQHNEHRIVLARLLFLLDENIFGGTGVFLIVMNYVLVLIAASIYWGVLVILNRQHVSGPVIAMAALFLTAILFLWTQENNLTWGFQSQFFLAQLLPLSALLLLSLSSLNPNQSTLWFCIACILGTLSVGTMANGLLALPLLAVLALLLRMRIWRIAALLVLSVAYFWFYFLDYTRPPGHGSILTSFLERPLDTVLFTFSYLGSPVYEPVGGGLRGGIAAGLLGILFVLLSGIAAAIILPRASSDPVRTALIVFIVFIGGTALATAGGRVDFGLVAAVASRYTTPSLMAWAALICIFSPWLLKQFSPQSAERTATLMLVNTFAIAVIWFQVRAVSAAQQVMLRELTAGFPGTELRDCPAS